MVSTHNYKTKYDSVEEFYSGKSVFITGGSGFVGKALIEKLLYSCPDLKNVYVLIRRKKNVSGHQRISKILDSELFSRLKAEKPQNMKKIIPIIGNITPNGLGLAEEDKILIQNKVSVVFHLAAAIRFNQTLGEAMRNNVEGTRAVIHFAQQIKNLKTFIYMSTAFSHTDQVVLEEIIYPPPMKIEDVYEFLKLNGDDTNRLKEILKDRPNTYTFTKALTESLVDEIHGDMSTVIIRPSIVVAALKEPFRGWIDNWMGPAPLIKALAKGYMHAFYGESHYNFAIIPIDYVVNATIVAAAKYQRSDKVKVYNCCTTSLNPISLKELCATVRKESVENNYRK
ncbi:putative fatty acyl-CoA reductase CG5065 [Epargyreus clarus]|uniref:putative fatty acyl-CoA reductase CG5065 n=1 Tax=Epargyreus clarus TaxID=520877 RepID=UPI003C2DA2C9